MKMHQRRERSTLHRHPCSVFPWTLAGGRRAPGSVMQKYDSKRKIQQVMNFKTCNLSANATPATSFLPSPWSTLIARLQKNDVRHLSFFRSPLTFWHSAQRKDAKKNYPNWIFRHINRLEYRSKRISPEKSVPLFLLWEQNRQLDKADSAASSMGRLLKAKRVNPKYMCIAKTKRGRCGGLSADHRRRCRGCILWRKEELLKEVGDASGCLTVPFQRLPFWNITAFICVISMHLDSIYLIKSEDTLDGSFFAVTGNFDQKIK